jgi:glycosyltransferase involved in cell wall biosynthesis
MPRLTVLLPAHNASATIARAVSSTLRAMPRDSELAVIDDASDDGTAEVVAGLEQRRVRIIRSSTPLGISGGLTRLLAATDSEFVARMDADDVTLPWRFRYQLPATSGEVQVTFTSIVEWQSPGMRVTVHPPIGIMPRAFAIHLILNNPVCHPTMLARRSAIDAVGGYRNVPAEDYDLWIRLQLAGYSMRRLPLASLAYRLHDKQVTASEEWRLSSWMNTMVAERYSELTAAHLGRAYPRLNLLCIDPTVTDEHFESVLADFAADVGAASSEFSSLERRFISGVMKRKFDGVRRMRALLVADSGTAETSGH